MDINPTQFLRDAITTAEHFGFSHYDVAKKHPDCVSCSKKLENTISAQGKKIDALHGMLAGGAQLFCEGKLHGRTDPILFYTTEQVPRTGETAIALHIFNVPKSIAEAILIETSRALMLDLGINNHTVRINSLGDRESSVRYNRELTSFFRKKIEDMPESARELLKENAFFALSHLIEKEHDLAYRSPNPMEYLSDSSRKHFREIVEYLDMSSVPYEIDPKLIGHHECYNDAMFEIDTLDENGKRTNDSALQIRGGRYNEFLQKNTKHIISAAGAVAILRNKKAPARTPRVKSAKPSVYLIQLGFGPKITSLHLVDTLRKANVPVYQCLASDSLSTQLREAEELGVDYTVIIGQKEYVEGNVILRNMKDRNQENIPLSQVAQKLKRATAAA